MSKCLTHAMLTEIKIKSLQIRAFIPVYDMISLLKKLLLEKTCRVNKIP